MKVMLERVGPNGQIERIEVNIGEWGEVEATVQGIDGPKCADVSQFLDQLGTVVEDSRTAEYYAVTVESDFDYGTQY